MKPLNYNPNIKDIRGFLEAVAAIAPNGLCMEAFVLAHGTQWHGAPLLPNVRRGSAKNCFHNASTLAMSRPREMVYCEGYATSVIPLHHAWCILRRTGQVVDPTWDHCSTAEYIGVPFKLEYVCRSQRETGYNSLLDQWNIGFPLLRGQHPKAEWYEELNHETQS
jgi:hypothetical protein